MPRTEDKLGNDPDLIPRNKSASLKRPVDKSSSGISIPLKKKIVMNPSNHKQKSTYLQGASAVKPDNKLTIKLKAAGQKQKAETKLIPKAAAAFDSESDSEPEEMPLEARMRMKNIGRNTPTSAGPNSFNKGKLGFSDSQKGWESQQKKLLSNISRKEKQ